jgi:hypothetical protein
VNIGRLGARFSEYRAWAHQVHKQTGKGIARQLREIAQLRKFGGQCGISDYYWYRLYDEGYQLGRGAPDFIGWRLQQQFSLALNPRYAVLPAWDDTGLERNPGSLPTRRQGFPLDENPSLGLCADRSRSADIRAQRYRIHRSGANSWSRPAYRANSKVPCPTRGQKDVPMASSAPNPAKSSDRSPRPVALWFAGSAINAC